MYNASGSRLASIETNFQYSIYRLMTRCIILDAIHTILPVDRHRLQDAPWEYQEFVIPDARITNKHYYSHLTNDEQAFISGETS